MMLFMHAKARWVLPVLTCFFVSWLAACESAATKQVRLAKEAAQQQEAAARQRELCRDDASCTKVPAPKIDFATQARKVWNDVWFVFPKEYDYMNGLAFYWPSKRPQAQGPRLPLGTDWKIYLLPRSSDIPPDPFGYARVLAGEREGRVSNRVTLRPGLDRLEFRYANRETGRPESRSFIEYVATDRRDPEGLPPVLRCKLDPEHPDRAGGGAAFMWRDGIMVGVLIRGGNVCEDWPELFDEVMRVLALTERV